jgi:hypothetical protein
MAKKHHEEFHLIETNETKKDSKSELTSHNWRPNKTTIEEILKPSPPLKDLFDNISDYSEKFSKINLKVEKSSIIKRKEMQRHAALGAKFQGNIGEGITLRTATDKLGFSPDSRFDQSIHGFDAIYRDENDNPVIIESKFDNRGINALRNYQMQPEWIEKNAKLMQTPENERFTRGNAEIGHEILTKGSNNVRRIVIITDPKSLETKAFEGQPDRSWNLLGSWSSIDLEQPYLK